MNQSASEAPPLTAEHVWGGSASLAQRFLEEDSMADIKQRDTIKPQTATEASRADEFDLDLNPHPMAGQNLGDGRSQAEKHARTAKDVKGIHARFRDWSDQDLDEVPILPEGSRLEQDATYLDLTAGQTREFTATGNMSAQPGQCLVPKSEVPYQIWNRLRGVNDPVRTGVAR
jgi:hypothetical protein